MKNLKGKEIRQLWLDFFKTKDHEVIQSVPLIPIDDPTLLWINAGVAPLKKYFDGREIPANKRMTNAQKSIRTNDIDNVGKTARHHTFFEMVGNFSIGDYFRKEAIEWACEILFEEKWFDFDKELIYITYYPDDLETKQEWIKNGIDESHLIPIVENFWEIGEGPCGPNTEIFFDRGIKYDPENKGIELLEKDLDNDRYIEIWNIVLSQYNSKEGLERKDYPKLPNKNIDTGGGLERLACIMQETPTNYETDLFLPLINEVEKITNIKYEGQMAFKVIADHIRSVTFAVSDGAVLSNEGRGYVIRRILRRAVRFGRKLGIDKPFLYELVDKVVEMMSDFYPQLIETKELVKNLVKQEEVAFLKTLDKGEKKLLDMIKSLSGNELDGKTAFLLYDTFGFPLELTKEVCEENNVIVNEEEFKNCLNEQIERARNSRSNEQSMNNQNEDFLRFNEKCEFTGYTNLKGESSITGIFVDGKAVKELATIDQKTVGITTLKTPFYGQMGGQVGDKGSITINNNTYEIVDTLKMPNKQNIHMVKLENCNIKLGDNVVLEVDSKIRNSVCSNHSATHLLNQALRDVLGSHVSQQGSQVYETTLRFDFNHFQSITASEILKIEALVKKAINDSYSVDTIVTSVDEAKAKGAQAVFGEKYEGDVRLVDMKYSKELCGGTHVSNTSDIIDFAILGAESKGSGIYRIEAVSGNNVTEQIRKNLSKLSLEIETINSKIANILSQAKENNITLKVNYAQPKEIENSYNDYLNMHNILNDAKNNLKNIEKEYEKLLKEAKTKDLINIMPSPVVINDNNYIICNTNGIDVNVLKELIDNETSKYQNVFVFVANELEDKLIFIAKSKNIKVNCGMIVKQAAQMTGGNGGGRPDFAQAGGKDISKVKEVLDFVNNEVAK